MDPVSLLARAREHVFSCGVDDVAEQLCVANMARGLAKIHSAQEQLGMASDALFIGAPDATVTRNTERWRRGFGYGGVVSWSADLAVLDALPNGCGMLVSALPRAPDEGRVRSRADRARAARLTLDGVALQYDLGESNHFVDACVLEERHGDVDVPEHIGVIHSSGHEHRASSPYGPGLYVHESSELAALARRLETPFGPIELLVGDDAARYYEFCARVQGFNKRRRELYARELFGEQQPLVNATHQGFRAPGRFYLGSYWFERGAAELRPLTLGPDQPLYLLRPRDAYSGAALDALGWRERARSLGVERRLRDAEVLPHGGGYAYPELARLLRYDADASGAAPRLQLEARDGTVRALDDVRALPFAYRGQEVLDRVLALGLAEVVARYRVRFVVK